MNLTLSHLLAGLLLLAAVWLAAVRSALCVLRKKNVPLDSAKEISRILSVAFFIIYLCSGALAGLALAPQATGFLHGILPQPAVIAPAPPPDELELPQGRMPAEQNRTERHRLLAEAEAIEKQGDQPIAGQDQIYVMPESIFGTNESEAQRWQRALREAVASQQQTPPRSAISSELPQQDASVRDDERVSVQELVLIAGSMPLPDDIKPPQTAAPLPQNPVPMQTPPPVPPKAASNEIELSVQGLQPPASLPQNPVQTPPPSQQVQMQMQRPLPPSQPVQVQQQPAFRQVRCEEIKIFMDGTDIDVLRAMSAKPVGSSDSWKGLRGRYTINRTGRKGSCAEYTLQADLKETVLQCRQLCQNAVAQQQPPQPAVSNRAMPAQQNDKNVIREAMDDADVDKFLDILEQAESTVPRVWRNPRSDNRYTVTLISSRGSCRDFDVQAIIQGEPFRYRESNCD
uniref:hypothetical protein n=1 Tax=Candidatus Electronema sp. TaxID=2698783 RepID=UPI004056A8C0